MEKKYIIMLAIIVLIIAIISLLIIFSPVLRINLLSTLSGKPTMNIASPAGGG